MTRRAWMVGALALVAVACSDGGTDSTAGGTVAPAATAENASVTTVAAAAITVTPLDPGVEVNSGSAGFVAITGPTEVAAGDVVRTDGTGFAEINYPDGSITRLDVDTEFEVVSITDDAGTASTRAALDGGRAWNRVQDLGTEGEFSVDTAVGVATVRGTAWVVDCRQGATCQFTVLDGKVDVVPTGRDLIPLGGPYTVTVDEVASSAPVPVPFDEAFADPWLAENAHLDEEAGFDPADRMYEPYGPLLASFDGQFNGTGAIVPPTECTAPADCSSAVGAAHTFDYVFSVECNGFMSCTRSVDMTYTKDGVTAQARATVQYFAASYFWTLDLGGTGCDAADPGNVVFSLTPLAAIKTGGKWLITEVALVAAPDQGSGCGGTGGGSGDGDCNQDDDDHDNNDHHDNGCRGRDNNNNND